ncbi:MAG: copper resistance protein [Caulobacteraceae bacterium]|nr:copper resistance protein [Caulobacteraceae bacterium]
MSLIRALLPAAALALIASQALAHAALVSSNPADKATVAATDHLTLKFSEAPNAKLSGVTLTQTQMMMRGKMTTMAMKVAGLTTAPDPKDKAILVVALKAPLSAGAYKLDWHAVADDSHRSMGTITFSVK